MDYSLTWGEAAAVVVSAVAMYAVLLLALRIAGRRITAALAGFDLAAGLCLGAIMGRTILGYTPSLPAGVLGIATLLVLHVGTRWVCRSGRVDRFLGPSPLLLMREGHVLPDAMRRARLNEEDLRVALRRASLGSYSEVGAMILERSGTISVIRHGQTHPDALADVEGWTSI